MAQVPCAQSQKQEVAMQEFSGDHASNVTVCIASIPTRTKMLRQAAWSVLQQTVRPGSIIIEIDHDRTGAVDTKNRALNKVQTEWVAWLDDDDLLMPDHIETLMQGVLDYPEVDVFYPWPEMMGNADPRPQWFGRPFDEDALRIQSYIPTTALIRADLAQKVGGFQYPSDREKYDDWGLWLAMLDQGAKFHHIAKRTWYWRVEGQNTSGDPTRW